MAETKNTSAKRGRPAKTKEEVVEKAKTVDVEPQTVQTQTQQDGVDIAELMAMLKEVKATNDALKQELDEVKAQPQPQTLVMSSTPDSFNGKKIKCINLMHNPINISTDVNGTGRVYSFEKYGQSRLIKFDDLSDIVASYPNTMEKGLVYICNPEVVAVLGLDEEYENIYTKEMIDEVAYLRRESDVDLFIGMDEVLQESTAIEMARLINKNEKIDLNYLARIKEETGYDIAGLADEIKKETTLKQ